DIEEFDKGFEYWCRANTLKHGDIHFDVASHRDFVARTIKTFSGDFFDGKQSWASDSTTPIFIFGMPRSGTTLIEQILASHSAVFGGGELQFFVQAEHELPTILEVESTYPGCLDGIHPQTARNIGEVYIRRIKKLAESHTRPFRITDKNPYNFLHLGLISLLFPNAGFVHCKRHPLDTCLSIYSNNFTTGNYFAYDLRDLGLYYSEYRRLMKHWRNVLPVNMFELSYEELIGNKEKIVRKLLAYCDLDWDPKCLEFYRNDRPVFTASNWQVRQPIYSTSCGRWQNYDRFLSPLKELLAGLI
ncbi:MAG: sulfotransferase, partial [Deltaproteobacteria bacterium]|nr:sulfotransferase [Deltaproteobacteria bacterium]